jgi:hypothetical protein
MPSLTKVVMKNVVVLYVSKKLITAGDNSVDLVR